MTIKIPEDTPKNQPLGKIATELLSKNSEPIKAIDLIRETDKDFSDEIEKIIASHKNYADKYYIQILFLQENLHRRYLPNIFKRKFIVRKSMPLPDFNTTLYSFDNKSDALYFHWTIPDESTCEYLISHETLLSSEEKELLAFVKEFYSNKFS